MSEQTIRSSPRIDPSRASALEQTILVSAGHKMEQVGPQTVIIAIRYATLTRLSKETAEPGTFNTLSGDVVVLADAIGDCLTETIALLGPLLSEMSVTTRAKLRDALMASVDELTRAE